MRRFIILGALALLPIAAARAGEAQEGVRAAERQAARGGADVSGIGYTSSAAANRDRWFAPTAWLQEDPGNGVYRQAREALNGRNYRDAVRLFRQLRSRFPSSGYVADSYYYQAFALYRVGTRDAYRTALELLDVQHERHSDAGTTEDADDLRVRIQGRLARMGDSEAAGVIAEQASGPCDEDQELRLAALSALLNMNAEQAVPILREVLQSRDECAVELRRRAVFLISQHMDEEAVDVLVDLAHRNPDPDHEVRDQAVFWLSQVRSEEALAALEGILRESDDEALQERALFAISQHDSDRSVEVLKDYAEREDVPSELRENAIFWIGQSGRAGSDYLIDLYDRVRDPDLRERTLFGIAQSGGPEARAWLLERARDPDESTEVRKNALFWAGQTGGLEAVELQGLYATLTDPEMKEQVIFVASQMSGEEAVDLLMEIARVEEDRELREKAIFWLGQSKDPRVAEFLLSLIRR